jgi:hypothetical protein
VERRAEEALIKFNPLTPVRPEKLVNLVRKHKGVRLDPSGTMSVKLVNGLAGIVEEIRNVLLQLEPES